MYTLKKIVECDQCGGLGVLEVRNAYDLDVVEYEDCEYCKQLREHFFGKKDTSVN